MDKNNFTVEDVYELAVTMSEKGEYNEAFKCYSYTAERGHLSGQFNLAYCYFYGEGTEVNHELTVKWYKIAAEKGHAKAQNSLAWCYYEGTGVEKNYEEAIKWWTEASKQGHEGAIKKLKELRK